MSHTSEVHSSCISCRFANFSRDYKSARRLSSWQSAQVRSLSSLVHALLFHQPIPTAAPAPARTHSCLSVLIPPNRGVAQSES